MTPLEISILLHYHVTPTDYRDGDFSAPAVRSAMDQFKDTGFLALSEAAADRVYAATEKTTVFVEALCAVPEPVQHWVIPVTQGAET